jgi:hypothetical protein
MKATVKKWQAAVEANPVHPHPQGELAKALFAAGDYESAVEAALRATELGAGEYGEMALLAARAAMRAGDSESGAQLLLFALDLRYRDVASLRDDPDFAPLAEIPQIAEALGIPDVDLGSLESLDRTEGWQFDIDYFDQELRRRAPNPFGIVTPEELDGALDWLDSNVSELSDAEILLNLDRLLVPLRDGHAYVLPAPGRVDLLMALPVAFYRFEEGVFITQANARYAHLVGKQVVEVEGRTIGEVAQEIMPTICADNPQWPSELIPFRLRETAFLHALGLTAHPDRATFLLMDETGAQENHTIVADDEFPTAPLGRNFPFPDTWVTALDSLPERPLYLRDLRTPFWYASLPDLDAIYLQINSVRDGNDETLAAFGDRFFAMLEEAKPERLIIDIRMNKGGDTTLEWPFLYKLIASPLNQRGKLFVVIGRRTWSAAQNLATYLDFHTNAIFVGEPTGSSPNFTGESIEFRLPWSGTRVNISDLYWQSGWPWDRRPWIPPDLLTPPNWAAYRAGRDVALEAIAQEIAKPTLF